MTIQWEKGGSADVLAIDADAMTLRSSIPSPPGSRIDGALASDAAVKVRFKIHSSKKQADGLFVLVGRPIDLTTDVREKLQAIVVAP